MEITEDFTAGTRRIRGESRRFSVFPGEAVNDRTIKNMNINDETESKPANNREAKESVIISDEPKENDSSLQALVSEEQSYVRRRLRRETGREPTQEEVDKWLSEQTEGY